MNRPHVFSGRFKSLWKSARLLPDSLSVATFHRPLICPFLPTDFAEDPKETSNLIRSRADAAAFIIACYSDPGFLGIAESAMLTSLTRGSRFGVISILEQSLPRHERYVRALGLESRSAGDRYWESAMLTSLTRGSRFGVISILEQSLPRHRYVRALGLESRSAGDRAIGIGVTELTDEVRVLERMVSVGKKLREEDGADVLIMGCAGMARYRRRLETATGLPVIDPTQAAVTLAIGAVQLK